MDDSAKQLQVRVLSFFEARLRATTGLSEFDTAANFFELGLDSMQVVQFITDAEAALPVDVMLFDFLLDDPSVAGLTTSLMEAISSEEAKLLDEKLASPG